MSRHRARHRSALQHPNRRARCRSRSDRAHRWSTQTNRPRRSRTHHPARATDHRDHRPHRRRCHRRSGPTRAAALHHSPGHHHPHPHPWPTPTCMAHRLPRLRNNVRLYKHHRHQHHITLIHQRQRFEQVHGANPRGFRKNPN